ncbi:1662_t:CDS:10 [Acaulospora morrowiae]|uniref:Mitochondrial import inner membrane translocase subunit TIM50 n=1 Tax=Acaulospora morrowiae TaxID=94023 RepID=A0A9N9ADF7_9GLOM|nr:1662_t:CDS:10 [Acaulospora morrowiae]
MISGVLSLSRRSAPLLRCNYCLPHIIQEIRLPVKKRNTLSSNVSRRFFQTKLFTRTFPFSTDKRNLLIPNISPFETRGASYNTKDACSSYLTCFRRQSTVSPNKAPTSNVATPKKGKGPKSKSSSADTLSPRAKKVLRVLSVVSTCAGIIFIIYSGRPFEGDREDQYKSLDKFTGWSKRLEARGNDLLHFFTEPSSDKLLPDKNTLPNYSPYTLVINLDQTLIYSTWDRENGWRTAKRPGVDFFLFVLSNLFEVVIFTSQPSYVADQILTKLDPLAMVPLRLYRESTRYVDGKIVKDLSKLNRDLSKVIIMDSNADSYSLQPDNSIAVPPWKGDPNDSFLIDIIPFLEHFTLLSPYEIKDVRPILKQFRGVDIPKAYAEWEEQWKEKKRQELEKAKSEKKGLASWASVFGVGHGQDQIPQYQQALLHRQMAHEELVQHYKSIKEQSPELQRAMKQDMDNYEKQIAERMKEQKMTLWQLAIQGPPKVPFPGQEQNPQSQSQTNS